MKLESKDPIIRTLLSQIEEGEIDLEPEFQRGEVWNVAKQQMLIDTILRNWQMPPVFVVLNGEHETKAVLDGHQRLTSIVNFYQDRFRINGEIKPDDHEITSLDNLYYSQLPDLYKKKFQNYAIRIFEITDYEQSEPFELFFRLNQSVKLTSAERRNTFFGAVREQVKQLVELMEHEGYDKDTIGFSNTRLSYHDVIARVLYALESKSLERKITDIEITERYRSDNPYSYQVEQSVSKALIRLMGAISFTGKIKLSKPSLFTFIEFVAENINNINEEQLRTVLETYKNTLAKRNSITQQGSPLESWLLKEYTYRLSTSVNDIKSVVLRRFFLYYISNLCGILNQDQKKPVEETLSEISDTLNYMTSEKAYDILLQRKWGVVR